MSRDHATVYDAVMPYIPKSELGSAVERKIKHIKIFGIPCVIGSFLLAVASYPLRYLPSWVFMVAVSAELLFGVLALWRIHSLKNPKTN